MSARTPGIYSHNGPDDEPKSHWQGIFAQQRFPSVAGGVADGRFWENGNGLRNEKADAAFHHDKAQTQSNGPKFDEVMARTPGIYANNGPDSEPSFAKKKTAPQMFVQKDRDTFFPWWTNGNGWGSEKSDVF